MTKQRRKPNIPPEVMGVFTRESWNEYHALDDGTGIPWKKRGKELWPNPQDFVDKRIAEKTEAYLSNKQYREESERKARLRPDIPVPKPWDRKGVYKEKGTIYLKHGPPRQADQRDDIRLMNDWS